MSEFRVNVALIVFWLAFVCFIAGLFVSDVLMIGAAVVMFGATGVAWTVGFEAWHEH